MEYLSGEKDIVFVGLNPVKEAIDANAVFCIRNTFWEIIRNAGIIKKYPDDLSKCADAIFNAKTTEYTSYKLGFADLVNDCDKKNSNAVVVTPNHTRSLLKKIQETRSKKIVLLGHKVARHFLNELDLNDEWNKFKRRRLPWPSGNSVKNRCDYGWIAQCRYPDSSSDVDLYVMPFPETSPIPEKHVFYKRILK
jgi:hypothetical protein